MAWTDFFYESMQRRLRIVKGSPFIESGVGRILVIQLGDIGDLVLSIPFIRSLKENFPSERIEVAARDKACELIELCPWVDGVIEVSSRKRGAVDAIRYYPEFFRRLRAKNFDLVFDLRTGSRGAVLALMSGARTRVSFSALDDPWRNRLFTHLAYPPKDMPNLHLAHHPLLILKTYGLAVNPDGPRLSVDDHRIQQASQLLQSENIPADVHIVAIQPFSLWRYKEWAEEKFLQMAEWIYRTFGFTVIFCGNQAERSRIQQMIGRSREIGLHNFAGKTSIAQYAALLSRCSLFIGCDSAGVHIAASVGVPTVSLYGPTSPAAWAPRGPLHFTIQKEMSCVPCRQKGCNQSGKSRCLDELTLHEVIHAIRCVLISLQQKALVHQHPAVEIRRKQKEEID